MKRGILFVVSGPSGTGKGTVLKEVFASVTNLHYSVSATTRAPRAGEVDGVNYFFVTNEQFDRMIADGEMLEYVEKFTNRYGTPRQYVERLLAEGKDVVLEIETIGAENVRRSMPECVSVFIAPPSLKELWNRLKGRSTDRSDIEKLRFETSREELASAYGYDYVVINDEVKRCADAIAAIIRAERSKVGRNKDVIKSILEN
ncbi:MAG: guanylate kinase [Clostridia bacterium]|nr:guanylate kinase [Clostridia bacterium]